jgi:PHD/YefM family antitoxin component YafN of YafNO toxin-antitoxin module
VIHSRGRDVAVLLSIKEFERLQTATAPTSSSGAAFLARVADLKQRSNVPGVEFDLEPVLVKVGDPFAHDGRSDA